MILQKRDIEILAFVLRYKYVSSDHVYDEFFTDKTRSAMSQVLQRLTRLGYIKQERFPRMKDTTLGNLIYLTDKGAKCLAREWETTISDINYRKVVYPIQSVNHFYHKKREIDFWIQLDKDLESLPLEIKDIATDGEREMRGDKQVVKTHIETHDGEHILIPDIYIVLQSTTKQAERLFFVEIDTGKETIGGRFRTVPVNSLLHKYQAYETILEDGSWQEVINTTAEVFEVLTVTETTKHIQTIMQKSTGVVQWKHLFRLTTHDYVQSKGILTSDNWYTLEDGNPKKLL